MNRVHLRQSGPVHTILEEFKNGGFALEMRQMFCVHTAFTLRHRSLKTQQSLVGLELCLINVTPSFSPKTSVFNMFSIHRKTKRLRFQICSV